MQRVYRIESEDQDRNKQIICNVWNDRSITDVTQIVLKIANEFKIDFDSCYKPQHTTWALLIKESEYKKSQQIRS